jgi:hypothetical protein
MRLAARWGLAVAVCAGAFAVSWWVCQKLLRLDEGAALGVAGAVATVVMTVTGWWAARERPGGAGAIWRWAVQNVRAGRDVNVAGRDQTIINYERRDK